MQPLDLTGLGGSENAGQIPDRMGTKKLRILQGGHLTADIASRIEQSTHRKSAKIAADVTPRARRVVSRRARCAAAS